MAVEMFPDVPAGQIRPARPSDSRALAAVHIGTWRDAYAGLLPGEVLAGLDLDEWAARHHGRLSAPADGTFVLVFESEGRVAGFVSGGPSRDEFPGGEVYAIYVDPGCQGRGGGRRLLAAAEQKRAGAGFTDASLWVLAGNGPARGFYEAQGWHGDGTGKPWSVSDGVSVPEIRYVKRIAS
jgi:ribosomal protein S18 acetylase RimI-like enzyme